MLQIGSKLFHMCAIADLDVNLVNYFATFPVGIVILIFLTIGVLKIYMTAVRFNFLHSKVRSIIG